LLKSADDHLHVEMLMMDDKEQSIKALIWTKYIPVSIKTGKRENHTPDFMNFAKSVENTNATKSTTCKQRLEELSVMLKLKLANS
jgi:hypothetical protein